MKASLGQIKKKCLARVSRRGKAFRKDGILGRSPLHLKYQNYDRLSSIFGSWLERYPWDWWATFTFRKDINPLPAKRRFQQFFSNYEYWTKDDQGKWFEWPIRYFLALEWHKFRSSIHIHALMGNMSPFRRLSIMDDWFRKYGIARIWPYDPKLGARYYLSKYLVKEMADWDFKLDKQLFLDYEGIL